jgi:hypothetical protein
MTFKKSILILSFSLSLCLSSTILLDTFDRPFSSHSSQLSIIKEWPIILAVAVSPSGKGTEHCPWQRNGYIIAKLIELD